MSKRPVIIGSGQYNYDVIKVREYPDGLQQVKGIPIQKLYLLKKQVELVET